MRSILRAYNLSQSDFKQLLSEPDDFIDSHFSGAGAQSIRSQLTCAYLKGFRVVFIIGAALAALSMLIVVFFMPQVDLDRPDDEKLKLEGKKTREETP